MARETLRLTTHQRLATLERENMVLRGKINLLHEMLKQQKQLIREYLTAQLVAAEEPGVDDGSSETLGSAICQQRFERMEQRLEALAADASLEIIRRVAV